jgi:hypothetical protein
MSEFETMILLLQFLIWAGVGGLAAAPLILALTWQLDRVQQESAEPWRHED